MNPEPSTSFYRSEGDSVTKLILPNFRIRCGSANKKKKSNSGCNSENKKNPNQRPNTQQKIQNCIESKKKIQTYSKFNHYYYQISCASYSKVLFYSCRLCTFSLKKKKSLYKHFRVNHPDIFPFPCRFCTSGFMFSGIRRNHELKYHTLSCSICKLNFCCQTNLTEHCKTCLFSIFNRNDSNNNPVNVYSQCETCVSKCSNEIYHKKYLPDPYIQRRLIQDHTELVSPSTNFNSVVTPKKIKQVNIKGNIRSMPLLNSYEDMNINLERNNCCACSSLHNKCKVRDNNANNYCGTLQDLFGPISDSESEVSIKEEIVDLELENDWGRCNSLQLYSSYRNTCDKATQTIINSLFMSNLDSHLCLSNLDNHRSSSKFNLHPFTSNRYKESFCSYNNNDQYMKCYICSFNTFKIDSMIEHWSKNHSKIRIKALSDNLNELVSQKQTEKKQKAHNKIKQTACNEKKPTAHIKTPHNRKKEINLNENKLTALNETRETDCYEKKLMAPSKAITTLLNDKKAMPHNDKILTPLNEEEVTAEKEQKETDFYDDKIMAQSATKETLLNDKKAMPHNDKIQTPLNEKEVTVQSEKKVTSHLKKKETNLNVRKLVAQSKMEELILNDKEAIAQNNKIQTPLNYEEVTAEKEQKETDFYDDKIMAQSATKETLLNDKKPMPHNDKIQTPLNEKEVTAPKEQKETDFYDDKIMAHSATKETLLNKKAMDHNELAPPNKKKVTTPSIKIKIFLNKNKLTVQRETGTAFNKKKETKLDKKKLTDHHVKEDTALNENKEIYKQERQGTDFNGKKLTAPSEITEPLLNEEKLAPYNENEVTALSQMKETPLTDKKAVALNDMIQTPLDEKEPIAQNEKNKISLNKKKCRAQKEALSRQTHVGLRNALRSPYKTYYFRPSNKVDYNK